MIVNVGIYEKENFGKTLEEFAAAHGFERINADAPTPEFERRRLNWYQFLHREEILFHVVNMVKFDEYHIAFYSKDADDATLARVRAVAADLMDALKPEWPTIRYNNNPY